MIETEDVRKKMYEIVNTGDYLSYNNEEAIILRNQKKLREGFKEAIESVINHDIDLDDAIDFILGDIVRLISKEEYELIKLKTLLRGDAK